MRDMLPEPEPLSALIEALRRLPGVGQRSARRMAYHLLQYDIAGADQLSRALSTAVNDIRHCARCNSFSQNDICETCLNPKRNAAQLCIVETPADQNMIEASHGYQGLYYVLMGRIAPLEGVGPAQLNFERLLKRAMDGTVTEVILATNFTAEGETTAHYLTEILREKGLQVSRIARGIPTGSELEYVDAGTIACAFMERRGAQ